MSWYLSDAKNRFSELVEKALTQGPQKVTRKIGRREESVMVLSAKEYERIQSRNSRGKKSLKEMDFIEFLMSGPSSAHRAERWLDLEDRSHACLTDSAGILNG